MAQILKTKNWQNSVDKSMYNQRPRGRIGFLGVNGEDMGAGWGYGSQGRIQARAIVENLSENVDSNIKDKPVVERCGDLEQLEDHS